jgi:hypothetical protein
MRYLMFLVLFLVCLQPAAKAQATLIPAGTLLHCTMDDPTISPKTAQVGDPVLCHLHQVSEFGRPAFPRGSYLAGHLEAAKQPGHFIGKGYLDIVFDHIGLPNSDSELDARIVAAQGQHVDKQGDIMGHGHAKRDVVEWMIPPLWPWKVIMLPARGPQPKLKNEQLVTLKLMQDVELPQLTAYVSPSRRLGDSGAYGNTGPRTQSYTAPPSGTSPFVQGVLRSACCSCGGPAHARNASGSFDQADAAKLAGQPYACSVEIGDDLSGEGLLGRGQAPFLRAA